MYLIRKTGPSDGATALRAALGANARTTSKSTFNRPHLILNWGGEADPTAPNSVVLNRQAARRTAMNKLTAFAVLAAANVNIPKVWTSAEDAAEWRSQQTPRSNPIILARRTATGQGGEGITIVRNAEPIPAGNQLYTQYIRKRAEYRIHVIKGEAVAVQQKRRRNGDAGDSSTSLIRNHANGWVFCTDNIGEPADVQACKDIAVAAVNALTLDLAAVDVIIGHDGNAYVLEANTKPGLDSPTVLAAYVAALTPLHP